MERDSAAIDKMLTPWRPVLRAFRPEIGGFENIPDESCVFIANHNIGAIFEIVALLDAWQTRFPGRAVFGLGHTFAFKIPVFRDYIQGFGAIPATYQSASEALQSGASLLIFPGGNWEVTRPYHQRFITDLGNHYGWARIAYRAKKKIIPISIIGSHAVNPILFRSRWLASLLILPRLLGLTYFLVSASQVVWTVVVFFIMQKFFPLGLTAALAFFAFVVTPLFPVWPGKIKIRFGNAIDIQAPSEDEYIKQAYVQVQREIQSGMDALRK